MYQVEVKRVLVQRHFNPSDGWAVTVDLDAMELGKGGQNSEPKRVIAAECCGWLQTNNVTVGAHPRFGRADLVAVHPTYGTFVLEVEGQSSRQLEQALYSALGQTLLAMSSITPDTHYGIAVPDSPQWRYQLAKLPQAVRSRLQLHVFFVGHDRVAHEPPEGAGA